MRQVDTDALRFVSSGIGIGNPHTATQPVDFDDQVLQQVFDVGRRIPGEGVFDGWVGISVTLNIDADPGSTEYDSISDIHGVEETFFAMPNGSLDVWMMNIHGDVNAAGASAFGTGRVGIAGLAGVSGTPRPVLLKRFNGAREDMSAGGVRPLTTTTAPPDIVPVPFYVPRGDTILFAASGTDAATVRLHATLWVGPRGARPPGVA